MNTRRPGWCRVAGLWWLGPGALLFLTPSLWGADPAASFTPISSIRAFSPTEAAKASQVKVKGVVTYYDGRDYNGLFVQDKTAGIYVELPPDLSARPGDEIVLFARTGPGHFAPILHAHDIHPVGRSQLPAPPHVGFEDLSTGHWDSQRVRVRGIVRSVASATRNRVHLDIVAGNNRLRTLISDTTLAEAAPLIAATVQIDGVCYARFNRKRQLLACWLGVNGLADVTIESIAPPLPPAMPLSALAEFQPENTNHVRVKVCGVVTHQQPGRMIFIRDRSQGIMVKTQQSDMLQPGDVVEVLGFPALGQYEPFLEDGLFTRISSGPAPVPSEAAREQLLSGEFDADLVRIQARVVDRMLRSDRQVLVLQAGDLLFNAQVEKKEQEEVFSRVPNGSIVALTGICSVQPLENWRPRQNARAESFHLLLRSAEDIVLMRPPSWFTLPRVLWTLAGMSALALLAFLWAVSLRRKVHAQTAIIRQKVQREAVLEERSRIAREFHDSLEQELVGITMQLDAAAASFEESPSIARQCIELARTISRRSFSEVRRSVWDLRSHFLESGDLASALQEVTRQVKNGTPVEIQMEVRGEPLRLTGRVETNLLRIGQEAVSNAIRHGGPRRIHIELAYQPNHVRLKVSDDGCGFQPAPGQSPGHFGLLDMRERAEKIGGQFFIQSCPGQGSTVTVQAPAVSPSDVNHENPA